MQCPRCPASLPALGLGEHLVEVHIGHASVRWNCAECPFETEFVPDTVTHCLAESHDPLALRCTIPRELFQLAKLAQDLTHPNALGTADASKADASPSNTSGFTVPGKRARKSGFRPASQPEEVDLNESLEIREPTGVVGTRTSEDASPSNLTRKRARKSGFRPALAKEVDSNESVEELPETILQQSSQETSFVDYSLPSDATQDDNYDPTLSLHEDYDFAPPVKERKFSEDDAECGGCHKSVRLKSKGKLNMGLVACHVIACNKLKPFACEKCGYANGRKEYVKIHIAKNHDADQATVNVVVHHKERHELAVRIGISECFPNVDGSLWKGFSMKPSSGGLGSQLKSDADNSDM